MSGSYWDCAELLQIANANNNYSNVSFLNANLSNIELAELPIADGIWCSFTAAYFPDFVPVLDNWLKFLKPGGWIAIVEIDHLFGHHPLTDDTEIVFKEHYKRLSDQLIYDFEMGSKLSNHLLSNGLTLTVEREMKDAELVFDGPANEEILISWKNRLDRMFGLQNELGTDKFKLLKNDFLNCLSHDRHACSAKINYVVAQKPIISNHKTE